MTTSGAIETIPEIPLAGDFFFRSPLYTKIPVHLSVFDKVADVLAPRTTYDHFCPYCNMDSTFRPVKKCSLHSYSRGIQPTFAQAWDLAKSNNSPISYVSYACTRNEYHVFHFLLLLAGNEVEKVGQYPPIADFDKKRFKEFKSIMSVQWQAEISRAIGLASHGIGIGSFVYLRRVFESLIDEAHQKAKAQPAWDDSVFPNRMEEKILALKSGLPRLLVENRKIYAILSKGIHELGEDECLTYFEIMLKGIELILREKLEIKEREIEEKSFKDSIVKISSKLGN